MVKIIIYLIIVLVSLYFGSVYYQKFTSKIFMNKNLQKENTKLETLDKRVSSGELSKIVFDHTSYFTRF